MRESSRGVDGPRTTGTHQLPGKVVRLAICGDYPTRLTDQEEVEVPDQLSLLAERVI